MKKTSTLILMALFSGHLTQVSAQTIVNNPTGLGTAINTNAVTFEEEVGNIGVAGFNALGDRLAFTFETDDGYVGTTRFDRIELLEIDDSPMDLRINFGSIGSFRQMNNDHATGGVTGLVYGGPTTSATIDFVNPISGLAQPVTGVAFTANRLQGELVVSLFSDLARTQQIGSSITIKDNNANGGSNHSFFGYHDGNVLISSVSIDSTNVGQFWIDDLNISTAIPEPASLALVMALGATLPLVLSRKRKE